MTRTELLEEIKFRLSKATLNHRFCVEMWGLRTAESTYRGEFEFLESLKSELEETPNGR